MAQSLRGQGSMLMHEFGFAADVEVTASLSYCACIEHSASVIVTAPSRVA